MVVGALVSSARAVAVRTRDAAPLASSILGRPRRHGKEGRLKPKKQKGRAFHPASPTHSTLRTKFFPVAMPPSTHQHPTKSHISCQSPVLGTPPTVVS